MNANTYLSALCLSDEQMSQLSDYPDVVKTLDVERRRGRKSEELKKAEDFVKNLFNIYDITCKDDKKTQEVENISENVEANTNISDEDTSCESTDSYSYKIRLRALLDNFYDVQKLRIQMGNRIVAAFFGYSEMSKNRTSELVKAEKSGEEKFKSLEVDSKKIDILILEYNYIIDFANRNRDDFNIIKDQKLTDATVKYISNMRDKNIDNIIKRADAAKQLNKIKNACDMRMVEAYVNLKNNEAEIGKMLEREVKKHPMWDYFFADVRGCGFTMAAICLAYFDVHTARHASSCWKYAGLDVCVNDDGVAEGRSRKHRSSQTYIDKEGNTQYTVGLGYNPFVKTKLVGVLGDSFIKAHGGHEDSYGQIYRDCKHRYDNSEKHADKTKLHKHRMAVRYMVKQFIRDMWYAWRDLEGYELEEYYEVAVLGNKPHGYNEANNKVKNGIIVSKQFLATKAGQNIAVKYNV